jgi:putative hydrolase of the HAD superfamily
MFRLALDLSQAAPHQVAYLEDSAMFVDVAAGMGIRSILHSDFSTTCTALAELGLRLEEH